MKKVCFMLKALFKDISFKGCVLTVISASLLAFTLYNVHAQADVTEGGILGLALFFDQVLHLSPALTSTVLNLLCYLFGARLLGRKFIVYSATSAASFSLSYGVYEQFPPLFPEIASYPLIAALVGALLVGITCGICVRIGGAPSGDDALAMALEHQLKVRISWIYLASDLVVLSLSLTYIPLRRILYSLLTVVLSGQIIGFVGKIGRKSPKMPKYKIIATDLDGTLLNSKKEVSAENVAAIHEMAEMGVFFVPSSGRTLGEFPASVNAIPDTRYIIYSNGAGIYDSVKKAPLDTRYMKKEHLRPVWDLLFEYESLPLVHYNGDVYVNADFHSVEGYDSYRAPRSYQIAMFASAVPMENFKEFCYGLDEVEMLCVFFKRDSELEACREKLLASGLFGVAATETTNIEFFDKDAGKGSALLRLADLLGIDRRETVAVGDNVNDLDNFSHAGLSLAMGNATDEIKAIANQTICTNDEHAMKYILEHILR